MQLVSDLPPYVLDQILGACDSSYVFIKLWLCGDRKLNDKLSMGLTLLDLKCHRIVGFHVLESSLNFDQFATHPFTQTAIWSTPRPTGLDPQIVAKHARNTFGA